MNNYLMVINAGSSSIKFAVYQKHDALEPLVVEASGQIDGIGNQPRFTVKNAAGLVLIERDLVAPEADDHTSAITLINTWLITSIKDGALLAVGHRVVHGGQYYSEPVLIDASVLNVLESLIPLAPLHQPHNLVTIRALLDTRPTLPQVACFDTAFHNSQPVVAQRFALPRRFSDQGVRRYGFHGLSYEYIASVLPTLGPKLQQARIIVAHLGNGASLCALQNGRSIATTMGFSPLDGLVMGTRCGNIDPGVLLYLMNQHGMDADALQQLLYHESGLLGVSGISSDMRTLLASEDSHAHEAIELFVYRIGREIGSLIAALGGMDALVFTGGIGENSAVIRAKIGYQVAWMGVKLDESANQAHATCISTVDSKISTWVVPTDENLMIARHTIEQITTHETISDSNAK
ncbi:acetate/propionate family kinase [Crenothrix sp.]|uniref:acetate/propionate family kinase n=1 Tax=Crenothrix sp. TaxID=3100433 RepID=UPI00374CC9A3